MLLPSSFLTLSFRRSVLYKNHSIDLLRKGASVMKELKRFKSSESNTGLKDIDMNFLSIS